MTNTKIEITTKRGHSLMLSAACVEMLAETEAVDYICDDIANLATGRETPSSIALTIAMDAEPGSDDMIAEYVAEVVRLAHDDCPVCYGRGYIVREEDRRRADRCEGCYGSGNP